MIQFLVGWIVGVWLGWIWAKESKGIIEIFKDLKIFRARKK